MFYDALVRIAVTGASGFIGSHVVAALVRAGHVPVAFVRSEAKLAHAMAGHDLEMPSFVLGDIADAEALEQLCASVDAIVHTAGVVTTKNADPDSIMTTNVGGTRAVIDTAIAAELDPIVHMSSVAAVFPSRDSAVAIMTSEDPTTSSTSLYARSKAGAEAVARSAQAERAPVVIFYPGGVFGPNDPGTSDIIDGTLLMLEKGAFVLPKGCGNAFIDVRDLSLAVVAALEPGLGPRRFMAGGTWVEWDEWIGYFTKQTDAKIRIIKMSASALHRVGSILDALAARIPRFDAPITAEMVEFMSWAKPTDDSRLHDELAVSYRPVGESVHDFVAWLRSANKI